MHRREFLRGLGAAIAAPAIVHAAGLMPVRGIVMDARLPYGRSPLMDAVGLLVLLNDGTLWHVSSLTGREAFELRAPIKQIFPWPLTPPAEAA